VALLRGIDVGGRRQVAVADLRDGLMQLGFGDPRSLLASGNLVVRSAIFVRTSTEWGTVIAATPFPEEADRGPGYLVVMSLRDRLRAGRAEAVWGAIAGRELVGTEGRHASIVCPGGIGRSRLTSTRIQTQLGTRGTGRNWNTVLKLGALAGA
jgi:uncharacterized protein (DUF1697 family)